MAIVPLPTAVCISKKGAGLFGEVPIIHPMHIFASSTPVLSLPALRLATAPLPDAADATLALLLRVGITSFRVASMMRRSSIFDAIGGSHSWYVLGQTFRKSLTSFGKTCIDCSPGVRSRLWCILVFCWWRWFEEKDVPCLFLHWLCGL